MNRIEDELTGEATVVNLDVLSRVGREAMRRYGVRTQSTLLVLDGCGKPVALYYGIPNAERVVEAVRSAPACLPVNK